MTDAKNNRPLVAGGGAETFDAGDVSRSRFYSTTNGAARQDLRLPSGKIGGVLFGNVLRKTVFAPHHFCRKHRAFGIDAAILEIASHRGATICELVDQGSGAVWRVDLATVRADGIRDDLGSGPQIFLPLGRWKLVYKPDTERPAQAEPEAEPGPVQLALFGERL